MKIIVEVNYKRFDEAIRLLREYFFKKEVKRIEIVKVKDENRE